MSSKKTEAASSNETTAPLSTSASQPTARADAHGRGRARDLYVTGNHAVRMITPSGVDKALLPATLSLD